MGRLGSAALAPLHERARRLRIIQTCVTALKSPLVLVVQTTGLASAEARALRAELRAAKCSLVHVRGSLLRLVLRSDASLARLVDAVQGSTALVRTAAPPADAGARLRGVLARRAALNHMHVAGGVLCGSLALAPEGVLAALRAVPAASASAASAAAHILSPASALLGRISAPSRHLVSLLERYVSSSTAPSPLQ